MIINANLGIKHSILMHVIILCLGMKFFFSVLDLNFIMFDHYRIKHDKDMHTYNYGNNSYYYKEDAIHYDRRNYFYQEYTSYSCQFL